MQQCQVRNKIDSYYPATGPLRRALYVKHMEFFAAGAAHRERAFIAGNRVGKTEGVGCYETTLHLTGLYPDWWTGHRWDRPINAWAAGDTYKTTRDILQSKLLGKIQRDPANPGEVMGLGTGVIPFDTIGATRRNPHISDALESVTIKHKSGGFSNLVFKSYDQGRECFQGTEQDLILLDEEPDEEVYTECLMRTMATGAFKGGHLLATFTPLNGWSAVVTKFLSERERIAAGRFVVQAGWDDAPHLSKEEKEELLRKLPAHQRQARSQGVPQVGEGAIYPISDDDLMVDAFPLPAHWPRAYGLDVGWTKTACVWGMLDRETDVLYIYDLHYRGECEISVHVDAIKSRGDWIPGAVDPASAGSSQADGESLLQSYRKRGLLLTPADNGVEAGITEVFDRMSTGRLKVFRHLGPWFDEKRLYRRERPRNSSDGAIAKVVKEKDHALDATRYLCMTGVKLAKTRPAPRPKFMPKRSTGDRGWMA